MVLTVEERGYKTKEEWTSKGDDREGRGAVAGVNGESEGRKEKG